jgi:hypothetical protein
MRDVVPIEIGSKRISHLSLQPTIDEIVLNFYNPPA